MQLSCMHGKDFWGLLDIIVVSCAINHYFFQMKRDLRDICFLSDLIDRARVKFSPFQRLVLNFIYIARFQNIFILLRFEKVFI